MPVQDKDTNPPYMPYHRLPTINLFTIYPASNQVDEVDDEWVFGLPLPANRRVSSQQEDTDGSYDEDITEGDMEGFVGEMDETLRAQGFSNAHQNGDAEEEKLVDM